EHCGTCTACLDACPTNAFPGPFPLDARRFLSYLPIEFAGPWPEEFRAATGSRSYGCDDSLAYCPRNTLARAGQDLRRAARPEYEAPRLAELAALDAAAFRALFTKSPTKRIGRNRFVRNVLYAIGNSADPALIPAAQALLDDPDPVVRDAVAWAVGRLGPTATPAP